MNNTEEQYKVTSMQFKGEDSVGHYNYLLSFNKSLVHTGNLSKIEDGLNDKTNQTLQELKERVEELKNKPLKKQKEGAERLSIRMNREATEKLRGLNEVITLIDEAMS